MMDPENKRWNYKGIFSIQKTAVNRMHLFWRVLCFLRSIWNNQKSYTTLFHLLTVNIIDLTRFQKLYLNLAICKSLKGESGNGRKGMMRCQESGWECRELGWGWGESWWEWWESDSECEESGLEWWESGWECRESRWEYGE